MCQKNKISASLSCVDLMNLQKEMERINTQDIDFIHYDVVDGIVNECFIFGELLLERIREYTVKPIEVHLALKNVQVYLKPFIQAGANYVAVHYEYCEDLHDTFKQIRELGAKPILAFCADTEVPEDFIEYAKEVEWVLKLTVNPGFAGQEMQEQSVAHIAKMRECIDAHGLCVGIQVDGNMNNSTIPRVLKAGATTITGGTSGLFNDQPLKENIKKIRMFMNQSVNEH